MSADQKRKFDFANPIEALGAEQATQMLLEKLTPEALERLMLVRTFREMIGEEKRARYAALNAGNGKLPDFYVPTWGEAVRIKRMSGPSEAGNQTFWAVGHVVSFDIIYGMTNRSAPEDREIAVTVSFSGVNQVIPLRQLEPA